MNSIAGSTVPSGEVASRAGVPEVSLFRLYALRAAYLLMAVGLACISGPS